MDSRLNYYLYLMQDILLKVDGIEEKVQQLAQKVEYLRKENMMLIEENVKLRQVAEKIKTGSIAQGQKTRGEDVKEEGSVDSQEQIRSQLEDYVAEIDKCIELINNM